MTNTSENKPLVQFLSFSLYYFHTVLRSKVVYILFSFLHNYYNLGFFVGTLTFFFQFKGRFPLIYHCISFLQLDQARVQGYPPGSARSMKARNSHTGWLFASSHPTVNAVNLKVAAITGMRICRGYEKFYKWTSIGKYDMECVDFGSGFWLCNCNALFYTNF